MSNVKKVKGVGWDVSATGNAIGGGARLADVLELVAIPKLTSITNTGGKHVEFVSVDLCKPLNRDHEYPLRVIVPGVIGARSVKWLDIINIIAEECQGFFMQKGYKMFPPTVNWDDINWSTRRTQTDFPVQPVVCSLDDVITVKPRKIRIHGYAVSGGGRGIERVDVSLDSGKTWIDASRYQRREIPYDADSTTADQWAWVLFTADDDTSENTEIVAKAVDIAGNGQPENVEHIWNLRGIMNTSWHWLQVHVS